MLAAHTQTTHELVATIPFFLQSLALLVAGVVFVLFQVKLQALMAALAVVVMAMALLVELEHLAKEMMVALGQPQILLVAVEVALVLLV